MHKGCHRSNDSIVGHDGADGASQEPHAEVMHVVENVRVAAKRVTESKMRRDGTPRHVGGRSMCERLLDLVRDGHAATEMSIRELIDRFIRL